MDEDTGLGIAIFCFCSAAAALGVALQSIRSNPMRCVGAVLMAMLLGFLGLVGLTGSQ